MLVEASTPRLVQCLVTKLDYFQFLNFISHWPCMAPVILYLTKH
jgi:hypothetical protein